MKHSSLLKEIRDDFGLILLPTILVLLEMKPGWKTGFILALSAIAFVVYRSLPWRHGRWRRSLDEDAETFRTWITRSHAVLIFILILAPTAAIIVQLVTDELPTVANDTFVAQGAVLKDRAAHASVVPPLKAKLSYIGVIDGTESHVNLNTSEDVIRSYLKQSTSIAETLPFVMLLFFFVFSGALLFGEHIGGRTYGLER